MKVAVLFLIALISSSYAVQMHNTLSNAQLKRIENIKSENTWASTLMSLAELHLASQGPVDQLVTAIRNVIADIEKKTQSAHDAFERRTNQHNSEVRKLTDMINEASRNIGETQEHVNNVLLKQKKQLTQEIADLQTLIKSTQVYIEKITADREAQHKVYLQRIEEHNAATSALKEAITILEGLNGKQVSLAEVKKMQVAVNHVSKKLHAASFGDKSFVEALLALTSSEFADSGAVKRVLNMMRNVLDNLAKSQVKANADEEKAQSDFEADVVRSRGIITTSQQQLKDKQADLVRTEEQITNALQYIEQRTADRAGYQKDLQAENDAYVEYTKRYNDLIAQLAKESSACSQALEVIQNASFADYIGNRMEMDKVIDKQHGSGIRVGGGDLAK